MQRYNNMCLSKNKHKIQNHELKKEFHIHGNGNQKMENDKLKNELKEFDKELSKYKTDIENLKQEIQKHNNLKISISNNFS